MAEFVFPELQGISDAYDRDGYAIVRQVLDSELLEELNRHIDWLIERHPELEPEGLGCHLIADDPFWVRFLSDLHLLDVAEALIGPDIALFAADYICKPPGTGKGATVASGRPLLAPRTAGGHYRLVCRHRICSTKRRRSCYSRQPPHRPAETCGNAGRSPPAQKGRSSCCGRKQGDRYRARSGRHIGAPPADSSRLGAEHQRPLAAGRIYSVHAGHDVGHQAGLALPLSIPWRGGGRHQRISLMPAFQRRSAHGISQLRNLVAVILPYRFWCTPCCQLAAPRRGSRPGEPGRTGNDPGILPPLGPPLMLPVVTYTKNLADPRGIRVAPSPFLSYSTSPRPSLTISRRSTDRSATRSTVPEGQRTSTVSTRVRSPSPKWARISFCDR